MHKSKARTQTDPQNNFMHYISAIEDKSKGKTVCCWSCCGGGGVLYRALSLSLSLPFPLSPATDSSENILNEFQQTEVFTVEWKRSSASRFLCLTQKKNNIFFPSSHWTKSLGV